MLLELGRIERFKKKKKKKKNRNIIGSKKRKVCPNLFKIISPDDEFFWNFSRFLYCSNYCLFGVLKIQQALKFDEKYKSIFVNGPKMILTDTGFLKKKSASF